MTSLETEPLNSIVEVYINLTVFCFVYLLLLFSIFVFCFCCCCCFFVVVFLFFVFCCCCLLFLLLSSHICFTNAKVLNMFPLNYVQILQQDIALNACLAFLDVRILSLQN